MCLNNFCAEIGKSGLKYCYKMLVIFPNLFYFDFFLFILFNIFGKVCACVCVCVHAEKMNIQSTGNRVEKAIMILQMRIFPAKSRENAGNTFCKEEKVRMREKDRKCQKTNVGAKNVERIVLSASVAEEAVAAATSTTLCL